MDRGTHRERVRLRHRETFALLGFRGVAEQFDLVWRAGNFGRDWMDAAASATLHITLLEWKFLRCTIGRESISRKQSDWCVGIDDYLSTGGHPCTEFELESLLITGSCAPEPSLCAVCASIHWIIRSIQDLTTISALVCGSIRQVIHPVTNLTAE